MDYTNMYQSRLKELIADLRGAKGVFPQRTKIRIEQVLKDGQGLYEFDLKDGKVNNLTTFDLKRDDVIVPNAIGVLLAISHKVGNTEVEQLYSFAPKCPTGVPSVFPVGFTTDAIDNLYNGNLRWTVGSIVAWQNYPMESFKKVYRQYGAFVLNSQDEAVNEQIPQEWDIDKMLQPVLAKYLVAGTQDHQMSVSFDAANLEFPLSEEGYTAKLVLYIDCFKIKNGTKIMNVEFTSDNPIVQAAWSASNM